MYIARGSNKTLRRRPPAPVFCPIDGLSYGERRQKKGKHLDLVPVF
jgi:hypothetical protein